MTCPFRYFETVFPVPTMERNVWGSNAFLATMNSCVAGREPYRLSVPDAPDSCRRYLDVYLLCRVLDINRTYQLSQAAEFAFYRLSSDELQWFCRGEIWSSS